MKGICLECKAESDRFTIKQRYCSEMCKKKFKEKLKVEQWSKKSPRDYKAFKQYQEIIGISVR